MTFARKNIERRKADATEPQELLGLYQRIWSSREGVTVIFRYSENEPLDTKVITCEHLISFMRSKGYIAHADESKTRFLRTDREMPRAESHRDLHYILSGHQSPSRLKEQSRKRKRLARMKRSTRNTNPTD